KNGRLLMIPIRPDQSRGYKLYDAENIEHSNDSEENKEFCLKQREDHTS
ncbi:hypothetical protein AVEN_258072-1, partial [Araneus ventricosus]